MFIKGSNITTNIFRVQAYDSAMCGYFRIGFISFVPKGKRLTDFTDLFSPKNFKDNDKIILKIYKVSSVYPNLDCKTYFRLNRINEIKDYFIAGISGRELMSKGFSKYIAAFDYFDKALNALSATIGGVSIVSSASIMSAPVGILIASFSFAFSLTTGITKKLLKTTRNKRKKHNETVILARSKLDNIEKRIPKTL